MSNINYDKESIFVVDKETFGIYYHTKSIVVANALSEGLLDSFVRILRTSQPWFRDKLYQNFKEKSSAIQNNELDNLQLIFNRQTKEDIIFDLPNELQNEKYRALTQLSRIRAPYLENLEKTMIEQLGKVSTYLNFAINPILRQELHKCSEDTLEFSPIIIEYATINGIPVRSAFNELQMKLNTSDLIYMRNYSFFTKYVRLFNQTTTKEDCDLIFKNFINDVFLKATV